MLPNGSYVALVTPMSADNKIEWHKLIQLVEWHLESGTDGLVILGTTGENHALTAREKIQIIEETVKCVDGKIPVIVGVGTSCTQTTCEGVQEAGFLGADGCMVVVPYYVRPTQEGIIEHFSVVSSVADLPIIAYDVPSRTGVGLSNETILKIAELENIVGLKDATGDISRLTVLNDYLPVEFMMFSGDDVTAYDFIKHGGHGVISVIANLLPKHISSLCKAALLNDQVTADKLCKEVNFLINASQVTTNPIAIKHMLNLVDKIGPGIRLPLTQPTYDESQIIKDAVGRMGLLQLNKLG